MIEFLLFLKNGLSPRLDANTLEIMTDVQNTLQVSGVKSGFNMGYETRRCLQKIGPWFYLSPNGIVHAWH